MVDIMVSDFRKGRYNLMKIYVGIDIAKLNHFAAAISSDGEIIIEPFKFTNDADGFQLLVSKLESFDKNSLIIGLESTAHYGDNLVRFLVTELYQVCVLNPIKTCQMQKNNVRKTKTDKVDTYVIAKTLMMQDNLRFVSFFDLDMMDLKALGRFRQKTIKQRTRLKIQLTTYVDQVFPEIQYFFKSGLHQHAVYALLKEAPSPKEIASMLSNPNKLLAFAGLDPSVYQSGNFQAKTTRMSKRGSRVLRYALVNAAWNVVRNNATFKAYYDAKRAEGRSHYNALGHCSGKLVRVIWKMLTDNVEFNLK